ncbi:MAG TPA: hypothetical protein VFM23_10140 [Gemmatimonadales bacterium]|nr:hypothetical protein [Gemmatimonadales bacterium]
MATFLCKALAGLLLVQSPQPADSVRDELWARVSADSTDGPAWLELGRFYLDRNTQYHTHKRPVTVDTVAAHATLDTAQLAFDRALRWSPGTRTADSARVFRVYAVGEKAFVDWESGGAAAATLAWHMLPESTRLPPVLEELGENLLRACPHQGLLLTAGELDTQAAWYLRFGRGLRPDLVVAPLERWRGDSVLRNRMLRDLRVRDVTIRALSRTRAVCASMGFEKAPELRPSVKWNKRPLVWVTGRESKSDRVPPRDFVFAALKLAIDEHETWTDPVLALYRRAVDNVGGLCSAIKTFGLSSEVGC